MGQRLNIEVFDGEKVLANSYYHWGAYSGSATGYAQDMIHAPEWRQLMDNPTVENAVRLLLLTGTGFSEEELKEIEEKHLLPNELLIPTRGRNEGIVSITEKGIEDTEMYAEGTMTIFTNLKCIDITGVFNFIGDTEEGITDPFYNEPIENIEDEDSEFKGMKKSDIMAGIDIPDVCLGELVPETFDKFNEVVEVLYENQNYDYLVDETGNIYALIA